MGYLISLFLAWRYRKGLNKEADDFARWDRFFTVLLVAAGVFIIVSSSGHKYFLLALPGYVLAVWLIKLPYTDRRFDLQRTLALSVIPLAIIGLVVDFFEKILPKFYNNHEAVFEIAEAVGWVWFITTLIMLRRQSKALKEAQALREQEARENRLNAQRKAELEVLVKERTAEIVAKNEKLEQALHELSAAQKQLIHAEKMASLGELTAGIAHEIQNPLNFVNNFAELNDELTQELHEALENQDWEEARALAVLIRENEQKIAHHGKRADSIVKSMLQHSRGGSGQMEKVAINPLIDECVRLSYHGMRAKDKSFNAGIELELDEHIPDVWIRPEEISRVILNLCTNAFYAVMQQSRKASADYKPMVSIRSRQHNHQLVITIEDNGGGIPADAIEKIFQPFFTTKPTGEGTGLGLSMSFDIITKGHNGKLNVRSEEGAGATFEIVLPLMQHTISGEPKNEKP